MREELPSLPGDGQLFENAPCGLLVLSVTGLILRANLTFCSWVGQAEIVLVRQQKLQDLFTIGGRIFHQTHWLPMLEMQGSVSEVKFDLRGHDGKTFPVLMNAIRCRDQSGTYDKISVVVAQERSKYERELLGARKHADELLSSERRTQASLRTTQTRLQQAMQLGAVFVWEVDVASGVRRYADEVALLLGFDAPRPVGEAAFLAAAVGLDRLAEASMLDKALKVPVPYRWTHRLTDASGVERVVVSSGQGFFDERGVLVDFVGTLVDVTESDRLRALAEDRALYAEQMVGIVSHDLRNPLQTILLSAQILLRNGDQQSERANRLLVNVEQATRRAQRMVTDLLDFTAARVGRGLLVQRVEVDIHAAVGRVVEELMLAFPGRPLHHTVVGAGPVWADADRIAQLIGNLVGNAMAYGDPLGVITVRSEVGENVSLSVHNHGNPIPADKLEGLFEPMVRGESVDYSARSVGLGLFIVRAIANAHRGTVTVSSTSQTGTEFVFRFAAK